MADKPQDNPLRKPVPPAAIPPQQPTLLDPKSANAQRKNTSFAFDATLPSLPSRAASRQTILSNAPKTVLSSASFETTIATQDLTGEKMLMPAKRGTFNELSVPTLGGIALISKLGQGGMGAVYLGRDPATQREIAVKVLPFHMAERDPVLIDRFFREAQIAMKIKSPNLVTVFDAKEEQGLCYILMEFVAGMSAGGYLKKVSSSGLDETEALEICIAAAHGLIAAHKEGIIHRDIKPDNILIPQDPASGKLIFSSAKLADLGLARSEEHGNSLTGSQASMGTPGYMSPEQAMDARKCGKPADIFSMGACLYALLCGRPPFHGKAAMEIVMKTINEPHEPLTSLRPNVSPPAAALIDRCLAKDPQFRFKDAGTLLEGLKLCRKMQGKSPAEQARAAEELRGKAPVKEAAPAQPYFDEMTYQASARPRQAEVDALTAENTLRRQRVENKLPLIAAVILAGFMGAGIAMLVLSPSKPERTVQALPVEIKPAPKPPPAPPPIEDEETSPPRKLSRELQMQREHADRMERIMSKTDTQFEKAKIVQPILPVSSVSEAYEDESYFNPARIMFSFFTSVVGLAYVLYSRKNGSLMFGICGALLMLSGWGVPWLSVAVMLAGVLLALPLFNLKPR